MLAAGSRARAAAAAAATVLTLTPLSACSSDVPARGGSTPPPTPIGRLNTAQLELHRIPFCDLLSPQAMTDALGGRPSARATWGEGGRSRQFGARGDLAQEFGCRFGAGSAVAAAWVFASPVEVGFARKVIADSADNSRCRDEPGTTFGSPGELQVCRLPGGGVRVRRAGLFGQTWLTCEVSDRAPERDVARRAGGWCVQVANVLNTSR